MGGESIGGQCPDMPGVVGRLRASDADGGGVAEADTLIGALGKSPRLRWWSAASCRV